MKYLPKKKKAIWEFNVNNFEELRDLLENKIDKISDYVFRGQSNANWQLTSTLDRLIHHARKTGAKQRSIKKFVGKHLDHFRLEIRGRRGDNPSKLEEDELWALGQHYGLATPLLDWSESPYISIFFALASLDNNNAQRVIWCLNRKKVELINDGLSKQHKLHLIIPDSDDNKRMLGQSGLFSKGPVMKHNLNAVSLSSQSFGIRIQLESTHLIKGKQLEIADTVYLTGAWKTLKNMMPNCQSKF